MSFQKFTLLAVGLSLLGNDLLAQTAIENPFVRRTPAEMRVFMSTRWMFGVDVRFDNVGTVAFEEGIASTVTAERIQFSDGFIEVDPMGSDVTSNFSFNYDNAQVGPDGFVDSFYLTRYAAESRGEFLEEEADIGSGIEVGFQYLTTTFLNERVRFGVIGGLGINKIDTSQNSTVESDFFRQVASVTLENSQITPVDGGFYVGGVDGPAIDLSNGLVFDPGSLEQVQQELPGQGVVPVPGLVEGLFEVDGLSTGLRLGGTAEFRLFNNLLLEAGGGISAVYLYSDLNISQTLTNTILADDIRVQGDTTDTEWFIGPYVEARLSYQFNRSTRFYIGAQYLSSEESLTQEINGVESRVILNQPFFAEFGINIRF